MSDLFKEVLETISSTADQRTIDWEKIRLGRFTASEWYKLMSEPKTKGKDSDPVEKKLSDGAKTYILEKLAEKLTGTSKGAWGAAIEWGEEHEREAVEYYEELTGKSVTYAHFNPYGENAGGSPDGYYGETGMIEIKCPFASDNHVWHLLLNTREDLFNFSKPYYWQIQANLLFAKKQECDFISYDPRMTDKYKMKILEIKADEVAHELLLSKLSMAVEHMNNIKKKLKL